MGLCSFTSILLGEDCISKETRVVFVGLSQTRFKHNLLKDIYKSSGTSFRSVDRTFVTLLSVSLSPCV